MKKILTIVAILVALGAGAQTGTQGYLTFKPAPTEKNMFKHWKFFAFPSTDSLRAYNNRWITNNAATAFTNLRLHYLLDGIIDFLDDALAGGGNGNYGIDSLAMKNDTTLRYRQNGVFKELTIKGKNWTLQQVINNSAILTQNATINILDSLIFGTGKTVLDSIRLRNWQYADNDSTIWKATVMDVAGNLKRAPSWFGAGKNIATSALKADADYIHNWNHFIFRIDSIGGQLNVRGMTPDLILNRPNRARIFWNGDFNIGGFYMSHSLRKYNDAADSIYAYVSLAKTSQLATTTFDTVAGVSVTRDVGANLAQLYVGSTSNLNRVLVGDKYIRLEGANLDSVMVKLPVTTSADTVVVSGNYNPTRGTRQLKLAPVSALGGGGKVGNGLSKSNDTTVLGGVLDRYTFIQTKQQRQTASIAGTNSLWITNHAPDSAIEAWFVPNGADTKDYERANIMLDKSYYSNDTVPKVYGGIIQGVTRQTFNSSQNSFKTQSSPMLLPYGGAYMVNQLFPPDSAQWQVTPFGGTASAFAGDIGIGGLNKYNLNIYSAGLPYQYPVAVARMGVDFARQSQSVKREMYGAGVTGYIWDYRSQQGGITSGTTDYGSYQNKVIGYYAYGNLYTHPSAGSKTKIMSVSKQDTVIGFYAGPMWAALNEVQNGYGFVSDGTGDYNYLAGKLRVGGTMPSSSNVQTYRLQVSGSSFYDDTLNIVRSTNANRRLLNVQSTASGSFEIAKITADYTPLIIASNATDGFPEIRFKNHRNHYIGAVGGKNSDNEIYLLADSAALALRTGPIGAAKLYMTNDGRTSIGREGAGLSFDPNARLHVGGSLAVDKDSAQLIGRPTIHNVVVWDTTTNRYARIRPDSLIASFGGAKIYADSVSGVSQVDVNLTAFAGFARIEVQIEKLDVSTNDVELRMRLSNDGASTFISGGSDYEWLVHWQTAIAGQGVNSDGDGDDKITLVQNISNGAGHSASGSFTLLHPFDAGYQVQVIGNFMASGASGAIIRSDNGSRVTSAGLANGFRLYLSSGTIDKMIFRIIGYKN